MFCIFFFYELFLRNCFLTYLMLIDFYNHFVQMFLHSFCLSIFLLRFIFFFVVFYTKLSMVHFFYFFFYKLVSIFILILFSSLLLIKTFCLSNTHFCIVYILIWSFTSTFSFFHLLYPGFLKWKLLKASCFLCSFLSSFCSFFQIDPQFQSFKISS